MPVRRFFPGFALVGTAALGLIVLSACADYTTTGEPAGDDGSALTPSAAADPLVGTSWELTEGPEGLLGRGITASFSDDMISGKAPVNTYQGPYEVDGSHITIGPLASTKKAGDAQALQAEGAFLAALSVVDEFEVTPSKLELIGHSGTLTFEPAHAGEPDPVAAEAAATQKFADTLIGDTEKVAKKATEDAGYVFRVIERDGQPLPATSDYRVDRVSVAIKEGLVSTATAG